MTRGAHFVLLGIVLFSGVAVAQAPDEVAALLEDVDALLRGKGARRTRVDHSQLCDPEAFGGVPFLENRRFFCRGTVPVGSWKLERLRADGGVRVSANLDVRRFASPGGAERIRKTATTLFAGEEAVGYDEWAISWCFHDVIWTDELVISLQYGCHISLRHVPVLHSISKKLVARGVPFGELEAVGVRGSHSGWSWLIDREGQHLRSPRQSLEVRFARVVGVKEGDTLRVRSGPDISNTELGKGLSPGTTCIPVVWAPPGFGWWRVDAWPHTGWANARHLKAQRESECPHDAGTP